MVSWFAWPDQSRQSDDWPHRKANDTFLSRGVSNTQTGSCKRVQNRRLMSNASNGFGAVKVRHYFRRRWSGEAVVEVLLRKQGFQRSHLSFIEPRSFLTES
jgi:hypothetical protein